MQTALWHNLEHVSDLCINVGTLREAESLKAGSKAVTVNVLSRALSQVKLQRLMLDLLVYIIHSLPSLECDCVHPVRKLICTTSPAQEDQSVALEELNPRTLSWRASSRIGLRVTTVPAITKTPPSLVGPGLPQRRPAAPSERSGKCMFWK